jgi:hypothetical protein
MLLKCMYGKLPLYTRGRVAEARDSLSMVPVVTRSMPTVLCATLCLRLRIPIDRQTEQHKQISGYPNTRLRIGLETTFSRKLHDILL